MGNACPNLEVTFAVQAGGGTVDGAASAVVTTNPDRFASVGLTLGPQPGANNNGVTVTFPGLVEPPAAFTASAVEPGPESATTFSGVVLDTENRPIPAAAVSIKDAVPPVETSMDDSGLFSLAGVPVGSQHLLVNGATSTRPGPWPRLEVQVEVTPGIDNRLGTPVYIPLLDGAGFQIAGAGSVRRDPSRGIFQSLHYGEAE